MILSFFEIIIHHLKTLGYHPITNGFDLDRILNFLREMNKKICTPSSRSSRFWLLQTIDKVYETSEIIIHWCWVLSLPARWFLLLTAFIFMYLHAHLPVYLLLIPPLGDSGQTLPAVADGEYTAQQSLRAEEREGRSDLDLYSEFSVTLPL